MAKKKKVEFTMKLGSKQVKQKHKLLKTKINQIDMTKVRSIVDLVENYKGMSIQARNIGGCADVLEKMLTDKERPTVLLGLAGPLIAGGLRTVIRDMIEHNLVDVIVSTGAILYQDLYQARGFNHFKGSPKTDDRKLRSLYIDRIYDTYVDEAKFWATDMWVGKFASTLSPRNYSSREFLWHLAGEIKDKNSILYTARKRNIPVFSPALNDSSIGIGLTEHYHRCKLKNQPSVHIDSIRDNYELTQIVIKSKRTSAIYIAGGVPKNYINDSVVMSYVFNKDTGGHKYALQLTTDSPHWGGLSGSTLHEAMSWGKVSTEASTSMGFVEPTVSLPLLVGFALQKRLGSKRKRIDYTWDNDILKKISYKE
ncbi:MAG: deoxyhypusine synthase family protein [Candidatus Omnitrophica bacterium]|nr:deoxyhypusine synthase family protein [Candidatus Omnitrophota bacterium]